MEGGSRSDSRAGGVGMAGSRVSSVRLERSMCLREALVKIPGGSMEVLGWKLMVVRLGRFEKADAWIYDPALIHGRCSTERDVQPAKTFSPIKSGTSIERSADERPVHPHIKLKERVRMPDNGVKSIVRRDVHPPMKKLPTDGALTSGGSTNTCNAVQFAIKRGMTTVSCVRGRKSTSWRLVHPNINFSSMVDTFARGVIFIVGRDVHSFIKSLPTLKITPPGGSWIWVSEVHPDINCDPMVVSCLRG